MKTPLIPDRDCNIRGFSGRNALWADVSRWMLRFIAVLWMALGSFDVASAVAPNTPIVQLAHTAWRVQEGFFPATPSAIAQTSDGYLWVGTGTGLLRFDGVHFAPWSEVTTVPPVGEMVISLLGDSHGNLWIGGSTRLFRWDGKTLKAFESSVARYNAIVEDAKGNIWVARSRTHQGGLCVVKQSEQLSCFHDIPGLPALIGSLAKNIDGSLWVSGPNNIGRWSPQSETLSDRFEVAGAGVITSIGGMAPVSGNRMWVALPKRGPRQGLQLFENGRRLESHLAGESQEEVVGQALYRDSGGSIWIGSTDAGVWRMVSNHLERFSRKDGLSGNSVVGLFEDREGSLWVATNGGVDRFRDLRVRTLSSSAGSPLENVNAVWTSNESTWVTSSVGLCHIVAGKLRVISKAGPKFGDTYGALLVDHEHRVWFGVDDQLLMLDERGFHTIEAAGKRTGVIVSLAIDDEGSVWAAQGTLAHIVYKIASGEENAVPIPGSEGTRQVVPVAGGGVWAATKKGLLRLLPTGRVIAASGVPGELKSEALLPNGALLVTNGRELFEVDKQLRIAKLFVSDVTIQRIITDGVLGVWLFTSEALLKINGEDLAASGAPDRSIRLEKRLDRFDGYTGVDALFNPTATINDQGDMYIASLAGLELYRSRADSSNTAMPPVHVTRVIVDHQQFSTTSIFRTASKPRDIEIDFTALSLRIPERVQFRYRLQGYDRDWITPSGRRSAFYTNLSPGAYRFIAFATNDDQLWNRNGASIDFVIPPPWYQTLWARLGLAAAMILIAAFAYRIRVQFLALQIRARFEERTLLARDLHDTLLQSIQGTRLIAESELLHKRAQGAEDTILTAVVDGLGRASKEARVVVRTLRMKEAESSSISAVVRSALESIHRAPSIFYTMSGDRDYAESHAVQGYAVETVSRIIAEALRNATVHGNPRKIAIEVDAQVETRIRIIDDGCGLPSTYLSNGRPGHFGLQGMKERASSIGARLSFESSNGGGTSVVIWLPPVLIMKSGPSLLVRLADFLRSSYLAVAGR